ncbi:MAG: hypothetical protein WBO92_02160 [Candidatus Moraniibacteriota bacterium]
MSLTEVNEELHRRSREVEPTLPGDADFQSKSMLPKPTDRPMPTVPLGEAWGGKETREVPVAPGMKFSNPLAHMPRKVALILGGIALTLIAAGLIFKAGGWLFTPENVRVEIAGPKRAESNTPVEYVIRYENNNWVDLDEAELIISFPEFFRFASADGFQMSMTRAVLPLGTVKKSSQNSVTIKGSFQSLQDQAALFTVTLRAAPKGVSSRVDTEQQYSVAVESSAVVVELSAPQQAGDNQFVDYVATYRNESTETLSNLELVIDYPKGFTYREADPAPSRGESVWRIQTLAPGASATVTARGMITGLQGDVKRVWAKVGVPQGDGTLLSYAEIERQTRIIASPLVILQKVGEDTGGKTVKPGEDISYRIIFRNDGDVGLRDLIVTVDVDPQYFNVNKINLNEGGSYNVTKQQIVFRAADRSVLSRLEPGQGGEIAFSLPVRADFSTSGKNNIEIESIARIDSPDVPTPIGANKVIASNRIAFKVKTDSLFELLGFHFDERGNIGPIPPVVGQETTYTLNLRVASTLNAIEDARVVLAIPGQVRYLKTFASGQGAVIYNDRTGEIFWNIGTLAPGINRPVELAIQISLTPDPSQVGGVPKLVNSAVFTGKDIWSGEMLQSAIAGKSIALREDPKLTGDINDGVKPAP